MLTVTAAQLRAIAGGKAPLAAKIAESFNPLAAAFGLTTPLRATHFLSQLSHESAGFRYVREIWGPTAAQKRYEGRADLGNTQAGDGKRYMGRGPIQITGRDNYRSFTAWIRRRYPEAPDFEAEPEKLETFPWAMMAAFWFWDTRGLNALADADNVTAVTRKINGGSNGLADRKAALARAKVELGVVTVKPSPVAKKAPPARPAAAPADLPEFTVRAIQRRLIALGYHDVGLVDGKIGPKFENALRQLQQRASDMGERVSVDGRYGPQTQGLLDEAKGDRYKAVVSAERASITAQDLAAVGTPAVTKSRKIVWSSVGSVLMAAATFGVALVQGWQSQPDIPWYAQTVMGFLPPWVLPVVIVALNLYNTAKAQGLITSAVERVREGIDNPGRPEGRPGGIFGSLFG